MAGANNAQLKKMYKARDVAKARAEYGKVDHDVMSRAGFAPKKGKEPPQRAGKASPPGWAAAARARSASQAPSGWRTAARREGGDQRRAATAARAAFVQEQAGKARRADLAGKGLRDVAGAMLARRQAAATAAKPKRDMTRLVERSHELHRALQARADSIRAQRAEARLAGASQKTLAGMAKKWDRMQARAERAHDAWFRRVSKATGF